MIAKWCDKFSVYEDVSATDNSYVRTPYEDVPLVEFMYPVFTRMPGGITVGDSGLFCVPCLSVEIY